MGITVLSLSPFLLVMNSISRVSRTKPLPGFGDSEAVQSQTAGHVGTQSLGSAENWLRDGG